MIVLVIIFDNMTALEFLNGQTLTSVEMTETLIINLVLGEDIYGMEVDTENTVCGTVLTRSENFTIENNILSSGSLSVNLEKTEML